MADQTAIEWCDSTFNPWVGCTKVGPGCDHCYAEALMDKRWRRVQWGSGQQRQRTSDANWKLPEQWQRQAARFSAQHGRRRRVFCASLADWLDNEVPIAWLVDLLELIRTTPELDWLLLTKRIGNWVPRISEAIGYLDEQTPVWYKPQPLRAWLALWLDGLDAPRNVWIGATVVNQTEFERDVEKLLIVPAAVHYLSVEPMLGPMSLAWVPLSRSASDIVLGGLPQNAHINPLRGFNDCGRRTRIDWVICGGESGPRARPMQARWAQSLRDQCAAAGVPFLFKQWGEWLGEKQDGAHDYEPLELNATDEPMRVGKKAAGRLLDGRTHDAWPQVHLS